MSDIERERKVIFEMVRQKKLTLVKASRQCKLSYRQTLRIYKEYCKRGDAGLIHGNRGRPSNRKYPHRQEIIKLYERKYKGFGATLASEYLEEEDGYKIDHETLRRLLISEGIWEKRRKRSPYRRYRECRGQFGELVQIDGSIHDWLGTGNQDCLLNMVDDATKTTQSKLAEGETTKVLFETMWSWFKRYGIPLAFYVDRKTVYVSPTEDGYSHFEIACQKLGIHIIEANSPEAKGRVERNHAVYQDRFVKDLSLKDIHTIREANKVLSGGFIDKLNAKFTKLARNPVSAHKPLGKMDLNQVLCWEYERQLQRDWTVKFQGDLYQIQKHAGEYLAPKKRLIVRRHLDGTVSIWKDEKRVTFSKIKEKPAMKPVKKPVTSKEKKHNFFPGLPFLKTNTLFFSPKLNTQSKITLRKRAS